MIAPFLFQNPEFIKNTRLEFSATRLAVAMGLLALISWTSWNGTENTQQASSLFSALSTMGFLFSIIWGSYLVANSLIEEEKQKTWDFVRLSSLSPAKILIGKIFGSPCLAWVVTLTGIFPLMIFSLAILFTKQVNLPRPEMGLILVFILCLAIWILLSYAFSFLLSIRAISLGRGNQKSVAGITILIFMLGSVIGNTLTSSIPAFSRSFCFPDNNCFPRTTWFGMEMLALDNALMDLTFACFWIVVGAYRSLRQALQFEDSPIAWIGFLVTTTIFLFGYMPSTDWTSLYFIPPLIFCGTVTLLTCVSEASDVVKYKRFAHNLTQKNYTMAFRYTPLWIVSFAIVITLAILTSLYGGSTIYILALLFLLRDLMAIHVIFWTHKIKRPDLGILVYFALIYVLVPALAHSLNAGSAGFFFPLVKPNIVSILLLAVETGILALFLARRWDLVFSKDFYSLKSVENKAN
ncbi:MAG: hypothetical protein JNN09_02120 [Alphaproteobacteria bacterium]|nr:hypothetical protein [Alphaproteobacteria bacterium]